MDNDQRVYLDISDELMRDVSIHKNVTDEYLFIATDKLRLCLIEYQDILTAKIKWIAPAGLVLSFLASIVAAEFKDSLGLRADIWETIFVIGLVASGIWMLIALYKLWDSRKKGDIEFLIQQIRKK